MTRSWRLAGMMLLCLALFDCKEKKPETSCLYGNNIPPEQLGPIIQAAEEMSQLMAEGKLGELYDLGSDDLKTSFTRDQFVFTLEMYKQAFGQIEFHELQEVYLLDSKSKSQPVVTIPCNLGATGINDEYQMPANREMAVAVYSGRSEMELCRGIFQMEKSNDQWKLRLVTVNPTSLKKKTDQFYIENAQKYQAANRLNLAVLYYKAAILIHDMGPNVTEFTVIDISNQISKIKVDYMPQGEPQIWKTDSGASYKIYNVDVAYDKGSLLVQIAYMTATLTDEAKLKEEAMDLATFIDKKFPDYRLGFDGFRITAAPEATSELMRAYHTVITFDQLGPAPVQK